jgi:WD40 repeat protein
VGRGRTIGRLAMMVAALAAAPSARGQAIMGPEDVLWPKLVLNGAGHNGPVKALLYSPDGKYLLSAGLDKVVHVWAVDGDRLRLDRTIRPPIRRLNGVIYAVAITRDPVAQDRRLLAVAGLIPEAASWFTASRAATRTARGTSRSTCLPAMMSASRWPSSPDTRWRSSACPSRPTGVTWRRVAMTRRSASGT